MKNSSKIIAYILCAVLCTAAFSGCGKKVNEESRSGTTVSKFEAYDPQKSESDYEQCLDASCGYTDIMNYTQPQKGEEIAVMTIKGKGTVKIKLFPELLPKACANFVGLASKGYYDGLSFHRIIKDFMIQGGDPLGNGAGGESVWGGQFDGGYSKYLYHVNGALAYANSGSTESDGSQFYVVVGSQFPEELLENVTEGRSNEYLDSVPAAYEKDGGAPWLDYKYTVFGQVFEGMDVINSICANTETNANNKPLEDVIIDKIEIVKY